jgi:hypothetical protein
LLPWRQDWSVLSRYTVGAPAVCNGHTRQGGHGVGALETRLDDDCGFALWNGAARDLERLERLRMDWMRSVLRLGLRGNGGYGSIAGILLLGSNRLLWGRWLRGAGKPGVARKRVVPACLGLTLKPPLLVFVLVVFMGKVASGDDLQAAKDHGYDVTRACYKCAIWQSSA